jgi:hypothetical protein
VSPARSFWRIKPVLAASPLRPLGSRRQCQELPHSLDADLSAARWGQRDHSAVAPTLALALAPDVVDVVALSSNHRRGKS